MPEDSWLVAFDLDTADLISHHTQLRGHYNTPKVLVRNEE